MQKDTIIGKLKIKLEIELCEELKKLGELVEEYITLKKSETA